MNLLPLRRILANQIMLRSLLMLVLLVPAGAAAQSAAPDPMSLRTQDAHQSLTVVADPYLNADRYTKELFGKHSPYGAGIVAIDVYFKNDNDVPVRINPNTVELVISLPNQERQHLGLLAPEDVADRTLLTGNSDVKARRPFPFPGSMSSPGHSKDWTEMTTTLRSVALGTDILAPHATTHGFMFFDMNHDFGAIHYAHLYIPDLEFAKDHKALFFFEIDLAEAPRRARDAPDKP